MSQYPTNSFYIIIVIGVEIHNKEENLFIIYVRGRFRLSKKKINNKIVKADPNTSSRYAKNREKGKK